MLSLERLAIKGERPKIPVIEGWQGEMRGKGAMIRVKEAAEC